MSERTRALERSLRDGPPDEAGYVARAYEPATELLHPGSASIGRLERVVPTGRRRIAFATAQPALAALLVVVIGLAGVAVLGRHSLPGVIGPPGLPTPTAVPAPTATPTSTPSSSPTPASTRAPGAAPGEASISIPAFTETFVSTRNGFSMRYPAGWSVQPATASWRPDTFLPLGNPALDDLQHRGDVRLAVASHRLPAGQTEQQWLAAYQPIYQPSAACTGTAPSTWPRIAIGGLSGYLAVAGCPVGPDISPSSPGVEFDAFVVSGGRVYLIELLGNVDRAYVDALLATFRLDPSKAIDPAG